MRAPIGASILALALAAGTACASPGASGGGAEKTTQKAVFAGGCFWCLESDFEKVPGVVAVVSGYAGGNVDNPTYVQVSAGGTGHAESVQVEFDPSKVTYAQLVEDFWVRVDPTRADGEFCDEGRQYRSAIFYANDEQKKAAEASKAGLEASKPFKEPILTEIGQLSTFWPAEDYHQDYYKKNPVRYKFYRYNCGRDARVKELWGDKAPQH